MPTQKQAGVTKPKKRNTPYLERRLITRFLRMRAASYDRHDHEEQFIRGALIQAADDIDKLEHRK